MVPELQPCHADTITNIAQFVTRLMRKTLEEGSQNTGRKSWCRVSKGQLPYPRIHTVRLQLHFYEHFREENGLLKVSLSHF